MVRLAKSVTDMGIVLALDLCRIATNTGECWRGVNAEARGVGNYIAAMGRACDSKKKVSVENFDAAPIRRAVDRHDSRSDCRSPRSNHATR